MKKASLKFFSFRHDIIAITSSILQYLIQYVAKKKYPRIYGKHVFPYNKDGKQDEKR